MRRHSLAGEPCPVARSLDVIGEWWTMVLVRDAFRGARRFEDFRAVGISDNILSARLKRLVEEGIFEKRLYQEHPQRNEYLLTEKGRDLLTVVAALGTWGRKWTTGPDATGGMTHEECGRNLTLRGWCEECGRPVEQHEVRVPEVIRIEVPVTR
jgi:DNA-binding HxlR family transcriptional regulator